MATNDINSDKVFEDLFIRSIVPSWWKCNSKVTYQFCYELFQNCDNYKAVLGSTELVIIQKALKCLDPSAILPTLDNFRNFKRKVTSKSKKDCNEPIVALYNSQDVIGPNSEAIGLSISAFTNIAYGNSDNEIKAKCVLSNKLVLELFRYYLANNNISIKHLCKVIYFLSGKEEDIFNDTYLYKRLKYLDKKMYSSW